MRATVALTLTCLAMPTWAVASPCRSVPPAVVEVTSPPLAVVVDEVRSPGAFAQWPKAMAAVVGPGWEINGLTVARPVLRTNLSRRDEKDAEGTCVSVDKVTVEFGFDDGAKIYISDRYRQGCEHDAIRAHEMQHVGIYLNARALVAPALKDGIAATLASVSPARDTEPGAALGVIQHALSDTLDAAVAEYTRVTMTMNRVIDTKENYLRIQAACSGW